MENESALSNHFSSTGAHSLKKSIASQAACCEPCCLMNRVARSRARRAREEAGAPIESERCVSVKVDKEIATQSLLLAGPPFKQAEVLELLDLATVGGSFL